MEVRGALVEKKREEQLTKKDEKKDKIEYSLYERFDTFSLGINEKVRIFFSEGDVLDFSLSGITNEFIRFDIGDLKGSVLFIRKEIILDIDQDGKNDLSIKYQKITDGQALIYFEILDNREENINYESIWQDEQHIRVGRNYTLIKNSSNRFLIEIFVKAINLPIYLSYNVDGTRQNTITLKKDKHILISAKNHLQIQIGNYNSSVFILNRRPINLFFGRQ